ncbi:ABC protein [Mycena venus]|uniref:ABC protein n=1 Tax=Mycena venus TaxID=2733690 RepID=A0A8H6XS91_9AGAR|nr:ABC protein [Mycena venus]
MAEENRPVLENGTQFGTAQTHPPQFNVDVAPGTRHYTLLNTNEPPEESELVFIQSVISEANARLTSLNYEISKLQPTLKWSEEERASVLSYRTRNEAILSPLRRIPPEVLADIFWWTLPSLNDEWARGTFDVAHSPWVLTWISARWRAVSVSTPSLWSQVAIDYNRDPSSEYSMSRIAVQIQRAQNLKIHFYGATAVDSVPQIQMFELLSEHSSCWEELSLRLTSSLVPLLPALHGRIQSLKRLWVEWDGPESQTAVQSIDCFDSAYSLLDFGGYNQYRFIPFALPTHQLTRYYLDGPWEEHKRNLKLSLGLVEARIVTRFNDELWPHTNEIIDLPYLRRLYVSNVKILDYLTAPVLEGLTFGVKQDIPSDIFLESFLDRSACFLRRLCVRGFTDATTATKILQRLSPSLTELIITALVDHTEAVNRIMSALTVSQVSETTVVAPQLRCLSFGCEDSRSMDYSVYLEMLKSRWRAKNRALTTAALVTEGPGPDPVTLHDIDALRLEGLDILVAEGQEAQVEMNRWFYGPTWNF